MEKVKIPLDTFEQSFKREYQSWSREYLQRPVFFEEWQKLELVRREPYLLAQQFHEKVTTNSPGNTIVDTAIRGDSVEIVRHKRYGLPILHNHAYIEMAYVYSGNCFHFINQQTIRMKEGDLCILAPDTMHAISVQDDDTIVINIMMSRSLFDSAFLKMLKGGHVISEFMEHVLYRKRVSPYLLYPTGTDGYLHEMFYRVLRERENKDYLFNESVTLYAKHIFIHLIRNYEMMVVLADPADNTQNGNILAIISYITMHYREASLKKIAEFFGYNENHMSKLIHQYTGKTFSALLTEIQMENAARLLRETQQSVTEISNEVGCYDSSHLTRKFRSQYGVSPNQYRKMAKEEQASGIGQTEDA